jgi:pimeloyl-ACP methyl ester carboxylesterase
MVEVGLRHNPRLLIEPVHVTGYSMGASVAAAAAADTGLLQVGELVLIEPVALRNWRLTSLLRSVRFEDDILDHYLADNDGVAGAVPPGSKRGEHAPHSRLDLALLGFGLSRGALSGDLLRAAAIQTFAVKVVHGIDSRLSRAPDIARLVRNCRRVGVDIQDVTVEGHHALWQSLPRVNQLAIRIRPQ